MNPTHDVAIFPWSGSKMSLQPSAIGFHPAICPVDALFCSPLHPTALTCLLTVQTAEQERGNIQAHGPPICLPAAWQGREPWGGWPLIGCGSSTLIWLALTCREVGWRGGGIMVWYLEETRDCEGIAVMGTEKAKDRAFPTKAFLSNDLKGRFCLPVLFVYPVLQFFICVLYSVYLLGHRACISMCTVYFYQHE